MQAVVDKYFLDCDGHQLEIDGVPKFDKQGYPIIVDRKPKTMTGLAHALGFKTRKSLMDYKNKSNAFNEIIATARMRVEEYTEERLFDKDGCTGAKFSLAVNFGWSDERINGGTDGAKEVVIVELTRKDAPSAEASAPATDQNP